MKETVSQPPTISRKKRPRLFELLDRIDEFDVVLVVAQHWLALSLSVTNKIFKKIYEGGAVICFEQTDQLVRCDSILNQFTTATLGLVDAMQREETGRLTRKAQVRKAKRGCSADGRCFGYSPLYHLNDGEVRKKSRRKSVFLMPIGR